jgi:hypothetical protein
MNAGTSSRFRVSNWRAGAIDVEKMDRKIRFVPPDPNGRAQSFQISSIDGRGTSPSSTTIRSAVLGTLWFWSSQNGEPRQGANTSDV